MEKIILALNNIRSAHNVGSIFRTADAVGLEKIFLGGLTPYPKIAKDTRLPYVRDKADKLIEKTALGATKTVKFKYSKNLVEELAQMKKLGYKIYSLEQKNNSKNIFTFTPIFPCVLVVGHETEGVDPEILKISDSVLEIPMHGKKESLNVSVAAGIALYSLRKL